MVKKLLVFATILFLFSSFNLQICIGDSNPGYIYEGEASLIYRNVTVYAPAVARNDEGYVGVISTITVTIQNNGSGRVFVDTLPLTQVDMQGSARLAVKVASALVRNDENCDVDPSVYDYFFVVRTTAPIIGGPSAGAIMTVATISLLENWQMDNKTVMTGMINPDASIGPVGGITYKIDAANSIGATRFLIPKGQGTYTDYEGSIATPVTKNVADYAMNNYGILVIEAGEINEALVNFTGYSIEDVESNGEITTQDYIEAMEPLATHLLENATEFYDNSSERFNNSHIPNYFPTNNRDYVQQRLQAAEDALQESRTWFDKDMYYTSTSKSFQSLIASRFVKYACEYDSIQKISYIDDLLDEVQDLYDKASNMAKNAEIKGYISLQSVGAAQRRASEAKTYLDTAKNSYENGQITSFSDVLSFLYEIAFVVERCNSIGWWIGIGSSFKDTGNLSNATIENIALEHIEEAQQSAIYSGVLLDEMGSTTSTSTSYLNDANNLIETASDDIDRGYPAAALFESLEALVKANLAIEIIGVDTEDKLEMASEKASNNIAKSRKQGIEPILAVSYFEYAENLANESAFSSALIYYKYSGMIAGALGFTNTSASTASSRYVGVAEYTKPEPTSADSILFVVIAIIIGGLGGLGFGIIIGSMYSSKDKFEKKNIWEPHNVDDYSKRQRKEYFSDKEMPRSIRDYYKKNK